MKKFLAFAFAVLLAAPLAVTAASSPVTAQQANANQLTLLVWWTAAPTDPRLPILRYEYTTDNSISWRTAPSTGVDAAGLPTYDNPMRLSVTSTGAAITRGVRYQVRLRAVNAVGPGEPSPLLATTLAPAAPVLTATLSGTTMSLSWTAAAGATSYRVFQNGSQVVTTTNRTATRSGSQGLSYSFRVEAVNDGGATTSNTVSVAIPVPPPAAPGWTYTAVAVGWPSDGLSNNVNVTSQWGAVSGANYYYYQLLEGWTVISSGTTTATSLSLTGQPHGGSYAIQVTACSWTACGEWAQSTGRANARHVSWPVRRGVASNVSGSETWVDTWTGRRAFYGTNSQPAGRVGSATTCSTGLAYLFSGFTMADGTAVEWRFHRNGWCTGAEDRFQLDWGSQPSYNTGTYRHNGDFYPSTTW
jgi:hypothetical protein